MSGKDTSGLSRRERQIMDVLYRRGRATANDVLDELPGASSSSTVRTQLRVLEAKGHVRHEEHGLRYVYFPTTSRHAARRSALKHLVEAGMLERLAYSERPARYEYALTEKGFGFVDVLMAMAAWGDRWTAGDAGPPVLRRHRTCGQITQVELRCSVCGETLHSTDVDVEPGPGLEGL